MPRKPAPRSIRPMRKTQEMSRRDRVGNRSCRMQISILCIVMGIRGAIFTRRALRFVALFLLLCSASTVHARPFAPAPPPLGAGIVPNAMYIEPDNGEKSLLRLLNHAQQSIELAAYILTDRSLTRALERAAAQGLDVHVMLEPHPFGMGSQPSREADALQAAGVSVRWSRPGFVYTHAKYLVIDDRTTVISTANFSRSAFTSNREVMVVTRERRMVREISNLFREDWDRIPAHLQDANILIAPDGARQQLNSLLAHAHHEILIYQEEFRDASIERQLVSLAGKGITLRILLPSSASLPADAQHLGIRTLNKPYIHAKVIIVDRTEAFVGSENFSTTSLDHNRELGVLIRGAAVGKLVGVFQEDWQRAGASSR